MRSGSRPSLLSALAGPIHRGGVRWERTGSGSNCNAWTNAKNLVELQAAAIVLGLASGMFLSQAAGLRHPTSAGVRHKMKNERLGRNATLCPWPSPLPAGAKAESIHHRAQWAPKLAPASELVAEGPLRVKFSGLAD